MVKRGLQLLRKAEVGPWIRQKIQMTVHAAFGKYLLTTNTVSSGILMLLGDLIEQKIDQKYRKSDDSYDYKRLAKMFVVGLSMGPVHHYYYGYVNKLWPGRDLGSVTKKILADQFVASPICIAQFFYTLGIFDNKSLSQMNKELEHKFLSVYTMDWCIWPPAQFINFYFIPSKFQVLYINVVTTFYNVFLSYIKYDAEEITLKTREFVNQ